MLRLGAHRPLTKRQEQTSRVIPLDLLDVCDLLAGLRAPTDAEMSYLCSCLHVDPRFFYGPAFERTSRLRIARISVEGTRPWDVVLDEIEGVG